MQFWLTKLGEVGKSLNEKIFHMQTLDNVVLVWQSAMGSFVRQNNKFYAKTTLERKFLQNQGPEPRSIVTGMLYLATQYFDIIVRIPLVCDFV